MFLLPALPGWSLASPPEHPRSGRVSGGPLFLVGG